MVQIFVDPPGDTTTSMVFLPRDPESFTHDADGNLLLDGRWTYQWNAENQLSRMETRGDLPTSVQRLRLDFTYDSIGRRTGKVVSAYTPPPPGDDGQDEGSGGDTGTWDADYEVRYVWDGWLLLAELDGEDNVLRSYAWGPDLSGTIGGAGGPAFQNPESCQTNGERGSAQQMPSKVWRNSIVSK